MEENKIKVNGEDFNFWTPIDIEKAGKNDVNSDIIDTENMYLSGLASTEELDLDNEVMDAGGLELDYLLERGFVNWHHRAKEDPSAIIGEPTDAKIVSTPQKGLFIRARIYDTPTGIKAFTTAKALAKQSKTRKLGWSVEGKIADKSGNRIRKAILTGVALTYAPKNAPTFADVCKAMIDGSTTEKLIQSYNEERPKAIIETQLGIFKVMNDGGLYVIEKSANTVDSSPIIREDLEGGNIKNVTYPKLLKKVLKKYPNISFEKALKIVEKLIN